MKITLFTTALAAIVGLAFLSAPVTVQAQTSTNATAPAAPSTATKVKKAKKTPYEGSITALDATSITVASTKKTLTLAITPTTKFNKNKVAATAADFAVGDKVTGSYSTDATGALSANTINKKTAKTAAAPAAAPAPAATPAAPAAPATTPAQ